MPGKFWSGVKRFILWDYPRAVWQYDVMVGLILAFLFLTPRDWFRDQPRIPNASSVTMLPAEHGTTVYWVDTETLAGVENAKRPAKVQTMLEQRTGRKQALIRLEPIRDSEDEVKGYMAFTQPQ
jgi:hypothetical protein